MPKLALPALLDYRVAEHHSQFAGPPRVHVILEPLVDVLEDRSAPSHPSHRRVVYGPVDGELLHHILSDGDLHLGEEVAQH